jgi:penicillin G amidase
MKILKKLSIGLLLFIALLIIGTWWYLQNKKPNYNQEIHLKGLTAETEVLYDEHGIPHIYAQNEPDAYYALGYVHAQDRLFQMEMLRRLADGRLSEIIGDATIEVDQFFRTLSFRQHAQKTIKEVYNDPNHPATKITNAYINGINAFIKSGKKPLEFDIIGIESTPFTFEDCLMVSAYMGFSFSEAFDTDPINTMILSKHGPDYLKDLQTGWDTSKTMIPVNLSDTERQNLQKISSTMQRVRDICQPLPPFHGSNSWILAPNKTKNGKVIFENDTHIGFGQPSVFYEAHLNYGDYSLYGNFIAGAPVPILGHTKTGVWGLTMFENDDVDFYKEETNPNNPNELKFKENWEPMTLREELIRVKNAPDVPLTVKRSRHGYIINNVSKNFKKEVNPIAVWWTYYEKTDKSLFAFYQLAHATQYQEAAQGAALIHAPGLNVMWGDAQGNIAWWAAGLLPKRPAHVRPYMLLDGTSGKDEIEGWLPFEQNPHSVNPASGFIYSANNQPTQVGKNPLVPGYYVPEDRAKRIVQLLNTAKKDWTSTEIADMTNDNTQIVTYEVVQTILPILEKTAITETEKNALQTLKNWKGTHDLKDVAPTIFYRWMYHFYTKTFKDEIGQEQLKAFFKSHTLKRSFANIVKNDTSLWWDNLETKDKKETRSDIISQSFAQTITDLEAQLGTNPALWQWEKVHTVEHKHPLGDNIPYFGKYFNVGPFPMYGGKETLNNLDFPLDSTGLYKVAYGPALRRVYDFSNPTGAMSINPTGQSGCINSPYYKDQAIMYNQGQLRHEWTDRKDIEKVKTNRMVFLVEK